LVVTIGILFTTPLNYLVLTKMIGITAILGALISIAAFRIRETAAGQRGIRAEAGLVMAAIGCAGISIETI
jgi:hypothetical protein